MTLLVVAATPALGRANSPWSGAYTALTELRVGPAALHLDLSLAQWAADGLLAVFFVAGLGDRQDRRRARLDVAGAAVHTHARLAEGLPWWDVLGVSLLTGIGFTVSLLVGS